MLTSGDLQPSHWAPSLLTAHHMSTMLLLIPRSTAQHSRTQLSATRPASQSQQRSQSLSTQPLNPR